MPKESVLSIIRIALTAVGAYLIGANFFGNPIDESVWAGIAGTGLTAIGVIWGIVDKTATVEMLQSGLRSVIVFVGTALVGSGKIKQELLEALLAIVAIVVPYVYSETSKAKNRMIEDGRISTGDLKK